MLCEMLNAPEGAVGSVTTGGTESITMAVKTARDWGCAAKPGVKELEIIVPRTAHPAFNKAAEILGLKPVRMAKSVDHRADFDSMARAIGPNTIMIVGSAPPFPYGLVDPIERLGALAERHSLWFHVSLRRWLRLAVCARAWPPGAGVRLRGASGLLDVGGSAQIRFLGARRVGSGDPRRGARQTSGLQF